VVSSSSAFACSAGPSAASGSTSPLSNRRSCAELTTSLDRNRLPPISAS
jgi:hypothetical protein